MKWQAISSHHSRWGWHTVILEADDDDWRVNLCSTRNRAISYSQGELIQGVLKARTPGDGEGQGSLASCSPWGRRELEAPELRNSKGQSITWQRPHRQQLASSARALITQAPWGPVGTWWTAWTCMSAEAGAEDKAWLGLVFKSSKS